MKVNIFCHFTKIEILSELSDILLECLLLNISKDSNNWLIDINIHSFSATKYKMATTKEINKKGVVWNKQYNSKTNKKIS